MAGDVSASPERVLSTESQTGAMKLVARLTANTARRVDLVAALTLHEIRVLRQRHCRTGLG